MAQPAGLAQRSISAVLWGTAGSVMQVLLSFGIQVVLARLLGPEPFGLFALVLVVITLTSFFPLSFAYGLIQKRSLTNDDLRFVNLWQLSIGAAVAGAVYLLASRVAGLFHEPRLAPLVEAMAIVCFLQAAAAPPTNLLTRELDFKWLAVARTASYALAYGMLGIPLALAGYGVRALVVAFVAQNVFTMVALYWRKPPNVGLVLWHREAPAFCRYAATVLATNLTNWALLDVGRAVVGKIFPSAAVGLYSLPYNLLIQLATALAGAVHPALFSASSRVQYDLPRLRPVFLTMLAATALLCAPLFAGMAAVPETITLALYGHAWADSAPLLRAFAIAMPFYLGMVVATPMLWTSGREAHEYRLQLPIVVALVAGTYVAAQHSLAATAWAASITFVLRSVVIGAAACHALGVRLSDVAVALRAGVAVSVLVAAAIMLIDSLARQLTTRPQAVLACDVATGFVVHLAALWLLRPWFSKEAVALFQRLVGILLRRI